MLNWKVFLLTSSSLFVLSAEQGSAAGEILRDSSGKIRLMTQFEASGVRRAYGKLQPDVCEATGKGHLPTVRELAEEAQARGAKGILEAKDLAHYEVPYGYEKISVVNPDGKVDQFYYSNEGFQRMAGDYPNDWFWYWSSSVSTFLDGFAGSLDFDSGKLIDYGNRDFKGAVYCVSDR